MTSIQVTQRLAFPTDAVWWLIGDFGGLHRWHPQVRGLDLSWEGRIRTLHYVDGGRAVERLEARNDAACRYVYALVDGSLPLQACRSRIEARAEGQHCLVSWASDFEVIGSNAGEIEAVMRKMHVNGLEALTTVLGSL